MSIQYDKYDEYTYEDLYKATCDGCGCVATQGYQTIIGSPGWLSERLRTLLGWTTQKGRLGSPLQWFCPDCQSKRQGQDSQRLSRSTG